MLIIIMKQVDLHQLHQIYITFTSCVLPTAPTAISTEIHTSRAAKRKCHMIGMVVLVCSLDNANIALAHNDANL